MTRPFLDAQQRSLTESRLRIAALVVTIVGGLIGTVVTVRRARRGES